MLISLEKVAFGYGENLIFSGVDFTVNEGERIGLIGANGEGKTTLLKLITGELSPDSGKIFIKNGARIGYLAQNGGYTSGRTVLGEMKEVLREDFEAIARLSDLSAKLADARADSAEYKSISAKLNTVTDFINSHGSFGAEVKIKTVLGGMGFSDCYDQVIDTMSGGEKTRLKLVRLLLEEPDVLILDEPTNHLDLSTLFWLEDYLSSFKGAILVVSHDRYFLDKLCGRICELENCSLLSFKGNYSKYKILKAERNARLLKEYEARQEEIAKLQDYVARNIVRATTAKSAVSRVKKLNKMEILSKPYVPPRPPEFKFTYSERPAEKVLSVRNLNLQAGGKSLICGGQFDIIRGSKVALVGENGTGKTTLVKAVAAGIPQAERGRFVKIALFDQEGFNLDPENEVLSELWARHVAFSQTEVRAALARCGLGEEDVNKKVGSLSGGERAKLALCVLESERANFLILDEPTNHLDLPAREALENALKQFDGTVLFVSHDRYFISGLADRILEISDGRICAYDGDYSSYLAAKSAEARLKKEEEERAALALYAEKKSEGHRNRRERAEEVRKKEKIKELEEKISALESEEAALNADLANPAVTADYRRVAAISERLSEIKNLLEALYTEYSGMI